MASSFHSKIRSTKNKKVTFLFCLGHGLIITWTWYYFPMQAHNQSFFKAGEVSWN